MNHLISQLGWAAVLVISLPTWARPGEDAKGAVLAAEQALLESYGFNEWAGKRKGPLVFHFNLVDSGRLLGPQFVISYEYANNKGDRKSSLTYGEVLFRANVRPPPEGSGKKEEGLYRLKVYECESIIQAHKMLCFSMVTGAGGAPPNHCLKGVDVGDKCFTPRSVNVPDRIFFARGNTVVDIRAPEGQSALEVAKAIDRRLCMSDLTERATGELAAGKEGQGDKRESKDAREEVLETIVPKLRDQEDAISVVASGGDLFVDGNGDLVLKRAKAEKVRVTILREKVAGGPAGGAFNKK